MVLAIIAVVLILLSIPLSLFMAYRIEDRTGTDSPAGAPRSPIAAKSGSRLQSNRGCLEPRALRRRHTELPI